MSKPRFRFRANKIKSVKRIIFILFLFISLLSAAEDDPFLDLEKDIEQEKVVSDEDLNWQYKNNRNQSWKQQAIKSNIAISEWFDSMAEGLDLFLVGEKVSTRKNKTSVRLENTTAIVEGENPTNTTGIGINLRLPNVEDYWQLKFTSYDEQEEKRGADKGYLRTTPRERNYGATVGFFQNLGNVKILFQPRIELSDPLQISHSLAFTGIAQYTQFSVNPKFELFANATKGTGLYSELNFYVPINSIFSFTFLNNAEYREKGNLFLVSNGFSIGQPLSQETSIAYNLIFKSINRPSYNLDSYIFSVSFNHLLYKKILDYQVVPYLNFAKIKAFKGEPGLLFNLNLNF
jgi:hypothetical protein